MTPENALTAACELYSARLNRRPISRLPEPFLPMGEDEAYQVQAVLNGKLSGAGFGHLAGYKIGCTTAVMQAYLGIPSPCGGGILSSTVAPSGAALNHANFRHPGVECEIAARLGTDVPAAGAPYDRVSIARFVEALMPAAEIVDDRYDDWRTIGTPILIADNFFGAGCVVGEPVGVPAALEEIAGAMLINGEVVGRGRAADVLGHPFEALAWLANQLIRQGKELRAGDLVLTGSVVQTNWVAVGDHVVMDLGELGSVALNFE
jgi:2-oxo-3-hexenedioate decarboxylase/2-keto-4-pentenoate hydratase